MAAAGVDMICISKGFDNTVLQRHISLSADPFPYLYTEEFFCQLINKLHSRVKLKYSKKFMTSTLI